MSKVHEIVTQQITEQLEKGNIPWQKPWRTSGLLPTNLISKKAYRGINTLLLSLSPYGSPYWLTFKQAKGLGGTVKKGEKGSLVVFYKNMSRKNDAGDTETFPLMRYYRVFNVDQCDLPEGKVPVPDDGDKLDFEPIARCEEIVEQMQLRPAIEHKGGRACYSPTKDKITLPETEHFHSVPEYYSTLFHELVHSTGHRARLDRDGFMDGASFGSANYSKEELTAEMGAAFLCGEADIHPAIIENSAAYIQGWLSRLKDDRTLLVSACAKAQKAADYITGADRAENSEAA